MEYFVNKDSIVRKIWGSSDTILFIFAGASAEFALNKAVDWLYFTGKLPSDPLGRLFSTVSYARKIVFAKNDEALRSIDTIAAIHAGVENQRGASIPDWAYRDVLFMLIDYSIRSFEVLERMLSVEEKEEVIGVFNRVGVRMGLTGLPEDYNRWLGMRKEHLSQNMQYSHFTDDLFKQYRKHLGVLRYRILIESQILVMPDEVRKLLKFRKVSFLSFAMVLYKIGKSMHADRVLKALILPVKYKEQIDALDIVNHSK
ncbi:oxygenase MpaB family protein [Flavobacterium hauense]